MVWESPMKRPEIIAMRQLVCGPSDTNTFIFDHKKWNSAQCSKQTSLIDGRYVR